MSELYEKDFYCWTVETAALLRAGRVDEADLQHVAEEIETMGRRERSAVKSRLITLMAHLLKWQYQPERRGSSWVETITRERTELPLAFEDSPSLRRYALEDLAPAYARAVKVASRETALPTNTFPETCPYILDQILDDDFFPEA